MGISRPVRQTLRSILAVATALALAAPALAVDGGNYSGGNAASGTPEGGGGGGGGFDFAGAMADVRFEIGRSNFKRAITVLKDVVAADPTNADALNLMGYSLRKSGDTKNALGFYQKALKINPRHRGAHEYLGELYVEIGQLDQARALLDSLERICGNRTCEEYQELAAAING